MIDVSDLELVLVVSDLRFRRSIRRAQIALDASVELESETPFTEQCEANWGQERREHVRRHALVRKGQVSHVVDESS